MSSSCSGFPSPTIPCSGPIAGLQALSACLQKGLIHAAGCFHMMASDSGCIMSQWTMRYESTIKILAKRLLKYCNRFRTCINRGKTFLGLIAPGRLLTCPRDQNLPSDWCISCNTAELCGTLRPVVLWLKEKCVVSGLWGSWGVHGALNPLVMSTCSAKRIGRESIVLQLACTSLTQCHWRFLLVEKTHTGCQTSL